MTRPVSFSSKQYLSGIDWLLNGLNYTTECQSGVGNVFQVALELNGVPDEGLLTQHLGEFLKRFPVLGGRVSRGWNLAPYWRIDPNSEPPSPSIKSRRVDGPASFANLLEGLERMADEPFTSEHQHIAFHLVHDGARGLLGAVFDHRLFDARGAVLFLNAIQEAFEDRSDSGTQLHRGRPAHLDHWWRKFSAGRNVNQHYQGLSDSQPCRALPVPNARDERMSRFRVVRLDQHQAAEIKRRAEQETGYLLFLPYALGVAVRAAHPIFENRGVAAGDYVISTTIDYRAQEDAGDEMFFNHLSFLMFRAASELLSDPTALTTSLKDQLYEQLKTRFPDDLAEMSYLSRIVPQRLVDRLTRLAMKHEIAFVFAYMGDEGYSYSRFMDLEVKNVLQLPRVPIPPGFGVFFGPWQGGLNVVISHLEGQLRTDEVDGLEDRLRDLMLGPASPGGR